MRRPREFLTLSAVSLLDQGLVSIGTFVTQILVAKHCGEGDVGIFALIMVVINYLRTLQERSISAPYLAFSNRADFKRDSFRGSSFAHQAILSLAIVVGGFVCYFVLWNLDLTRSINATLVLACLTVPWMLLRDHIRLVSAADFKYYEQLAIDFCVTAIQLGTLFFLSTIQHFSINYVMVVLGMACLAPSLYWLIKYRQRVQIESQAVRNDWHHNWEYSRWLVVARIAGIMPNLVIPFVILSLYGEDDVGAFGVCATIVGISMTVVSGLNNFFQPRVIREYLSGGVAGMYRSLFESLAVIIAFLILVSAVFFFAGRPIMATVFKPVYSQHSDVAFWLSINTLAVSFSIVFGNGLAALGKSRAYFYGELSCCIGALLSAIYLIPNHGLVGAAWALAVGSASSSIVTGLTLIKLTSDISTSDVSATPDITVSG